MNSAILIFIILSGFRLIASSIPLFSLVGVAVGVGIIFGSLLYSLCRNYGISSSLIRWAFIGFSLVEVSGFIGLVFCFMFMYALKGLCCLLKNTTIHDRKKKAKYGFSSDFSFYEQLFITLIERLDI